MNEPRASTSFELRFRAPETDIDELGHVSNVAYVRWIQDVAKAHSVSVGLGVEAYRELGAVFVVRRHEVDYLAPVTGGEEVALTTFVASFRGASSERRTRVTVGDREVARAVTSWAFVSLSTGRPTRISPAVVEAFAKGR